MSGDLYGHGDAIVGLVAFLGIAAVVELTRRMWSALVGLAKRALDRILDFEL